VALRALLSQRLRLAVRLVERRQTLERGVLQVGPELAKYRIILYPT